MNELEKIINIYKKEIESVENEGDEDDFEEEDTDYSLGYIDGLNFAIRYLQDVLKRRGEHDHV